MAEKIATRVAYGNALVELAEKYPELIVFDADLAGATKTAGFKKAYPDRFFDMGKHIRAFNIFCPIFIIPHRS